eukprot:scaffold95206_cov33-Tisochrysis_lutea.AAC.2
MRGQRLCAFLHPRASLLLESQDGSTLFEGALSFGPLVAGERPCGTSDPGYLLVRTLGTSLVHCSVLNLMHSCLLPLEPLFLTPHARRRQRTPPFPLFTIASTRVVDTIYRTSCASSHQVAVAAKLLQLKVD